MAKVMMGLLALLTILAGSVAQAADEPPIGKRIDRFAARDFRGKETSLDDFARAKRSSWRSWAPNARWPSSTARGWPSLPRQYQGSGRGVHRHRLESAGLGHRAGPLRSSARSNFPS